MIAATAVEGIFSIIMIILGIPQSVFVYKIVKCARVGQLLTSLDDNRRLSVLAEAANVT